MKDGARGDEDTRRGRVPTAADFEWLAPANQKRVEMERVDVRGDIVAKGNRVECSTHTVVG